MDIEAIRARLAAATPGPWYSDGSGGIFTAAGDWIAQTYNRRDQDFDNHEANSALIAHAPADLAALLAAHADQAAHIAALLADNARDVRRR